MPTADAELELIPGAVMERPTRPYAIYIAAPFQLRTVAMVLLERLEYEGYTVTSDWLRGPVLSDEQAVTQLDHLGDIDRSDALVLLNPSEWADAGTGGRHTEFGYAFARRKDLFVVGARTQVFHHKPNVKVVTQPELLVAALRMHLLIRGARG